MSRTIVNRHRRLDDELSRRRTRFVSDWNGTHPLAAEFLGLRARSSHQDASHYLYLSEDAELLRAIVSYHQKVEAMDLDGRCVLAGPGSSPLIAATCLWLHQRRVREVYYLSPLYYTTHYWLTLLGIAQRSLNERHLFDRRAVLALPRRRCVLMLCDPIWYAGVRLTEEQWMTIAVWQKATGSLVVVDGSFQFLQWDDERAERCTVLEPDLTLRIVCPAKALALPTVRFAYALIPRPFNAELTFVLESLVGSSSAGDRSSARRAMKVLCSRTSNRSLTRHLANTYERLIDERLISGRITPDCGYFVFVRLSPQIADALVMDQRYFQLRGFGGYARVNLLLADRLRGLVRTPDRTAGRSAPTSP